MFCLFFCFLSIHGIVYYVAQEINKKLNTAKNISSLLRQKIIKTFTSGEKVTEHKLLKNTVPTLGKTLFKGPSSSNINNHQLLLTKYGPGFRG